MKYLFYVFIFFSQSLSAQETLVRGHVDWQGHPAMHIAWPMYQPGLSERPIPEEQNFKHFFKTSVSAPAIRASGVRLYLVAAMAAEFAQDKKIARKLILKQFQYVEDFVKNNSADFAIAKSAEDARSLLLNTNKIVLVHSIEGGKFLLDGPQDAGYWKSRGVAVFTLLHLQDSEFGSAALNPDFVSPIINLPGFIKKVLPPKKGRGLSAKGKSAIKWLADAGIMVDLTHMAPQSVKDAMIEMEKYNIPPLVTHGSYLPIRKGDRGFSSEQIVDIYKKGGFFSIPLNGGSLDPIRADEGMELPEKFCKSSLDSFHWHLLKLHELLMDNIGYILGHKKTEFELTESNRVQLALGWASDFNGWTNHSRPKYGDDGCEEISQLGDRKEMDIDRKGLAHAGLLPQYWQRLEEQGAPVNDLQYSAEKFLQMWKQFQSR